MPDIVDCTGLSPYECMLLCYSRGVLIAGAVPPVVAPEAVVAVASWVSPVMDSTAGVFSLGVAVEPTPLGASVMVAASKPLSPGRRPTLHDARVIVADAAVGVSLDLAAEYRKRYGRLAGDGSSVLIVGTVWDGGRGAPVPAVVGTIVAGGGGGFVSLVPDPVTVAAGGVGDGVLTVSSSVPGVETFAVTVLGLPSGVAYGPPFVVNGEATSMVFTDSVGATGEWTCVVRAVSVAPTVELSTSFRLRIV
jgi:hypothetical protein